MHDPACSMFGRRTSVTQSSLAVTLAGVTAFENDFPTIVYWLVGWSEGLPVTVKPNMSVRSPMTGMLRFNCWPVTSSPYEIFLPPPDTTPSLHRQLALVHPELASRKVEQRLIRVGGGLTKVGPAVL